MKDQIFCEKIKCTWIRSTVVLVNLVLSKFWKLAIYLIEELRNRESGIAVTLRK